MINLPDNLSAAYNSFMAQKGIPASDQLAFGIWLRYYVDFFRKYHHGYGEKSSLSTLLIKLEEKKQPEYFRKQVQDAIALYHEMQECRKNRCRQKTPCRLIG